MESSAPTALFESHELDFQDVVKSIRSKLEGAGKEQRGEQRKAKLREVEKLLDDADEIVSQLEIENQGIPQSIKAHYQKRLREAKAGLAKYKKFSKELHSQATPFDLLDSSKLLPSNSDNPYGGQSDRTRLLFGAEVLDDGTRRLEESAGIAKRTEDLGADILRTLLVQREQIENSRGVLRTADTHIDRSSSTIKGMMIRSYRQRIILSAIGIFFIILIGVMLYFKLVWR